MARTLITGVSGFTGRYLAPLLAAQGHAVHGVVHDHDQAPITGVDQVHEADLADAATISRVVAEVAPDYVVHLAAVSFVAHHDVELMYRANILGTRQLLEALASLPRTPRSIILASSANVYGNSRAGVLNEELPPAPANDYGVTKVAMEYVASIYRERLPLIVARPFNYTGKGQGEKFIIPKIIAHAREHRPLIELGNVDVARDFSDVRSVVDAYARLLDAPDALGGTFNICSGHAVRIDELVEQISKLSGQKLETRVNPAFVRTNEVRSLCGSAAKLESVIGPLKAIKLGETLRWMLED